MPDSIKVAIIEPVGGHGGCTYYDFSLCNSLSHEGIAPTLYTCDETVVTGRELFQVKTFYQRIYGKDPSFLRGLRFIWGSLKSLIGSRLKGAKIAHFHFYHVGPLEFFNILLTQALFMRVVITAHDVEAFASGLSVKSLMRRAYRMADAVIAHNQISKRELMSHAMIDTHSIHVIKHGNHKEYARHDITRTKARTKLNLPSDVFTLVFFGQIKEVKGVDVLLHAMARVRAKLGNNVRLVIAGKVWKDDFSVYQRLIDQYNLNDLVELHVRYIPDDELPYYYAAADLMVLPYKRIYQSGVVLMAMTFGRPVLVSSIPGMTEVVTDGDTGLVFETENPDHMAEKIVEAYDDQERLKLIAERGRGLMESEYDWSKIGALTANLYRSII